MTYFSLSFLLATPGKPGKILMTADILGETISEAVTRAKKMVTDPKIIVLQTAALAK